MSVESSISKEISWGMGMFGNMCFGETVTPASIAEGSLGTGSYRSTILRVVRGEETEQGTF
jgi:hypothetical protein